MTLAICCLVADLSLMCYCLSLQALRKLGVCHSSDTSKLFR